LGKSRHNCCDSGELFSSRAAAAAFSLELALDDVDVAFADGSFNVDGSLQSMNRVAVPQAVYTSTNTGVSFYGLYDADVLDNLAFTNLVDVQTFVSSEWDYFVVHQTDGIATYRLFWNTHRSQELPMLQLSRAVTHMHLFYMPWDAATPCLSLSLGDFLGLNEAMPSIYDTYFVIYCWDIAHDRWNLVVKVPAFGVIKTESFIIKEEDGNERLFVVALSNNGHIHQHSFTTYEVLQYYEDDVRRVREPETGSYEQAQLVRDIYEELDDLQHYKSMIIAIVAFQALLLVLIVYIIVKGRGGNGEYA